MANVGHHTAQDDGTYEGEFYTLKHQFKLRMAPCNAATDSHPVYRVYSGKTEIGAAWENTAEETGVVYYTLRLNDPSFDRPIYTKFFRTGPMAGCCISSSTDRHP